MSDYNNNRDPYDPYNNARFEPVDSGRGPYILLAILVAIGVIGGLLYFNHSPTTEQQAKAPSETHAPAPTSPTPMPATPGGAANPAAPDNTTPNPGGTR